METLTERLTTGKNEKKYIPNIPNNPCNEIYRVEVVGLKNFNSTF